MTARTRKATTPAAPKTPAVSFITPGQRSGFMYTDAEIPVASRGEATENPHAEAVRHLVGTEKAKSFVVVEREVKRHINWLRAAGKLANVTVRTALKREDGSEVKADALKTGENDNEHVVIVFWTRDPISRTRKTDDDTKDSNETDESDADGSDDTDGTDDDDKADAAPSTPLKATPKKVTASSAK